MKYRFKVLHSPEPLQRVVELMKAFDTDIDQIGLEDTLEFSGEKDLPVQTVKEHIIKAYESTGSIVLKIEGGKVE